MPPMMPGMGQQSETNLLSILLNVAFGFIAALMFFFGVKEVLTYGTKLTLDLMQSVGYGQQFGGYAQFAPYVVITPIAGLVLQQLAAVRSIKSFLYFAIAIGVGIGLAFVTQGYFVAQIVG